MQGNRFEGLIIDLGVSEGNDTAFYLAKGFQVVAVEADPATCRALRARFAEQIEAGALQLLNLAAGDTFGATIDFYVHRVHQAISGVAKRVEVEDDYVTHSITMVDWKTLVAQAGMPRYLKIDVEGNEEPFLNGFLRDGGRPEFVSVECHVFRPCEQLFEAGYRRFKLVDQEPVGGFRLPDKQFEGRHLPSWRFDHATGPFGLDLFVDGQWMDFEAFRTAWEAVRPRMSHTWFDCHAWLPN